MYDYVVGRSISVAIRRHMMTDDTAFCFYGGRQLGNVSVEALTLSALADAWSSDIIRPG